MITLIALFRLTKAILLIAAGVGALKLLNPALAARVRQWVESVSFVHENRLVHEATGKLLYLSHGGKEGIAAGAFAYAALFLTEGVGLLMGKVWAEYLTIVATASFVPFELYEVVHKVSALRLAILVINIAIVVYFIHRRLSRRRGET